MKHKTAIPKSRKWTHVYGGPTLLSDGPGKVGIKTRTYGRIVERRDDGLVEFEPAWGENWLTVLLNESEVFLRGPEELERLL